MKENAKEYLKEFAIFQPDWLKALIYKAIETNGDISIEDKEKIYKNLIEGTALDIEEPKIQEREYSDTQFFISSLKHISGVNALRENEEIKFNENVTILYGLNGTGKSSYFRILNEIIGGNQRKEILPNIYDDNPKPIKVELTFYTKDNPHNIKTIKWDGTNRAVDELLNRCKVFDSSYLNGLLETRDADSTLIQPLGLHLFSYIANVMDEFKVRLQNDANKKREEKPEINVSFLREDFQNCFRNHEFDNDKKREIEEFFEFSEENLEQLNKIEDEIKNLKQINIQDKINLRNNDKRELERIKTFIEQTEEKLNEYIEKTEQILNKYREALNESDKAKKQFSVLSEIPGSDTEEWKKFIKSGEIYKELIKEEGICPYCHQPLDDKALSLIKAYGEFLKDKSEQEVNQIINNINDLITEIGNLAFETHINENVKEILKKSINNIDLLSKISKLFKKFNEIKVLILKQLKNKEYYEKINFSLTTETILTPLKLIIENIQKEIENFSQEHSEKNKKLSELEEKLKVLKENKSISEQKGQIQQWFLIDEAEKQIIQKANSINTRELTQLSKSAHNNLLTETLKNIFVEELKELGYNNLFVNLESAKGTKGSLKTQLVLNKNNNVKTILSEGEQKAVALALFIAETRIQKIKSPIILDDPVNSLDHKIAGAFAERLLQLENQIILFTHNRLFLDAFETNRDHHVCKTIDSACNDSRGKHIRIYLVQGHGNKIKGVLTNYKKNNAKTRIEEAKQLLKRIPFEDHEKVALSLRKAVESIIDEIIFNNQIPTKYSTKNNRIYWDKLKKLNKNPDIIDILKDIHDRVSGGELHRGTESEENPIDIDEFNDMIVNLENILKSNER